MIFFPGMNPSRNNAARMIHVVTYLTAITIQASYSAALISFLTIKTVHLPFTTMQGLIEDDTYKLGVLTGSADYVALKVIINL